MLLRQPGDGGFALFFEVGKLAVSGFRVQVVEEFFHVVLHGEEEVRGFVGGGQPVVVSDDGFGEADEFFPCQGGDGVGACDVEEVGVFHVVDVIEVVHVIHIFQFFP